jgi:hypothetical protein
MKGNREGKQTSRAASFFYPLSTDAQKKTVRALRVAVILSGAVAESKDRPPHRQRRIAKGYLIGS